MKEFIQNIKKNMRFPVIWLLCTLIAGGLILISIANSYVFPDWISQFLFGGGAGLEFAAAIYFAVAVQKTTPKVARLAQVFAALHLISIGVAFTLHVTLAREVSLYNTLTNKNNIAIQQNNNNRGLLVSGLNQYLTNSKNLIAEARKRELAARRAGEKVTPLNFDIDPNKFIGGGIDATTATVEDVRDIAIKIKDLMNKLFYSLLAAMGICFGCSSILLAVWEKDENQNNVPDGEEKNEDEEIASKKA